jgi:hypothetical protein
LDFSAISPSFSKNLQGLHWYSSPGAGLARINPEYGANDGGGAFCCPICNPAPRTAAAAARDQQGRAIVARQGGLP